MFSRSLLLVVSKDHPSIKDYDSLSFDIQHADIETLITGFTSTITSQIEKILESGTAEIRSKFYPSLLQIIAKISRSLKEGETHPLYSRFSRGNLLNMMISSIVGTRQDIIPTAEIVCSTAHLLKAQTTTETVILKLTAHLRSIIEEHIEEKEITEKVIEAVHGIGYLGEVSTSRSIIIHVGIHSILYPLIVHPSLSVTNAAYYSLYLLSNGNNSIGYDLVQQGITTKLCQLFRQTLSDTFKLRDKKTENLDKISTEEKTVNLNDEVDGFSHLKRMQCLTSAALSLLRRMLKEYHHMRESFANSSDLLEQMVNLTSYSSLTLLSPHCPDAHQRHAAFFPSKWDRWMILSINFFATEASSEMILKTTEREVFNVLSVDLSQISPDFSNHIPITVDPMKILARSGICSLAMSLFEQLAEENYVRLCAFETVRSLLMSLDKEKTFIEKGLSNYLWTLSEETGAEDLLLMDFVKVKKGEFRSAYVILQKGKKDGIFI
ncbi:uncharacterized protein MONOS_12927 [Monocercomonoides exilis]|uniref:uncharacterized protein n=1 Tax=Monocercomonoides exilis TaxID=2049356 RepID=UPI0035596FAB|nr:hypothetical protein MONOS_12927 [Monocercomonoides exilis]|eukprot:MONOS_12927.1-p1 / transcript=MONOS_12927.1 / gene=MONOS_12927 / organism=Monocercomonoides_exilis_PA203 / gene_product=unspecified product / transcript_product=unspecified product / location=Mono_scaffold00754:459-2078(+) / protein_length=493 / sequence_SO=supercontig / SO=protein_coding / is_pseudo=false